MLFLSYVVVGIHDNFLKTGTNNFLFPKANTGRISGDKRLVSRCRPNVA